MSPASAQTCRGVALEGGGPGPSHRRQLGLQAALCVFWLQFSLMVTFPEVPLGIFLFCMCVIAIGAVQVGLPRRLPSAHACPGAAPVWRRARRVGALRAVGPRRVVRRRRGQRRVGVGGRLGVAEGIWETVGQWCLYGFYNIYIFYLVEMELN